MNWFRRKPAPPPIVTDEEWDRFAADRRAAWERDNPVKTYRVSFLDGTTPIEIRARVCGRFDDEYLFRNPMCYPIVEAYDKRVSLVAVVPVSIIRAIEVLGEADDQQ